MKYRDQEAAMADILRGSVIVAMSLVVMATGVLVVFYG
jgi:hypothetical protein